MIRARDKRRVALGTTPHDLRRMPVEKRQHDVDEDAAKRESVLSTLSKWTLIGRVVLVHGLGVNGSTLIRGSSK